MKVSIFTVMAPDLDLQETIDACVAAGADGLEWRVREVPEESRGKGYGFWGDHKNDLPPEKFLETAADIKRRCDDAGLEMPSVGSYVRYDSPVDEVRMVAEATAICGAESFRCGPARYDGSRHYDELYAETIDGYRKLVEVVRPFGVKMLIETHPNIITPSASAALKVVGEFSADELGVIHDPGNMVNEGFEAWQMGFEMLGRYLVLVHAKNAMRVATDKDDADRQRFGGQSVALGEGGAYWPEVIAALKSVGYDGYLSLEDFAPGESREKIARDVRFLKDVLAEVA